MSGFIKKAVLGLGIAALAAASHAQETLKIGVLGGMTGPGAPWGLAIDGGVRVATEEINASGGLKVAGKTYQVEIVSYDDHYKAADAVVKAIEATKSYDGIQGKIVWGGKDTYGIDHQIATPAYLGVIENGKGKVVTKFDAR